MLTRSCSAAQVQFKRHQTTQKLRGGYYTPDHLADFLTRWVARGDGGPILEPSCGDGAFIDTIASVLGDVPVTAIEIDPAEAAKADALATSCGLSQVNVLSEDFLGWAARSLDEKCASFGAVVGNPPFIRYQYLPSEFQARAELVFDSLQCRFTRHTNAWVPFVLAAFALLRPGGRLGMVVPSEILHVMHAQSLRTFLQEQANAIVIIDPEELWFAGTLQGAVLLLAEKRRHEGESHRGVGIRSVRNREFVDQDPERLFRETPLVDGRSLSGKWTHVLLESSVRTHLQTLSSERSISRFGDVASVDVGIVTGANRFFLVPDDVVEEFELQRWAHPMFGRSGHCPGVIYDQAQHGHNASKGTPTNFIWFTDSSVARTQLGRRYLKRGEAEGLHQRYKCRMRKPWYAVPSVYATEVGMLKRCHDTPRLIYNEMRAFTTDTAYRVKAGPRTSSKQLVHDFFNPLTALTAELEGRHYGGGVLELVPSEIERLMIPVREESGVDLRELDGSVRSMSAEAALERQSRLVLGPIGIAPSCQCDLLDAWKKLRDRRQRVSS